LHRSEIHLITFLKAYALLVLTRHGFDSIINEKALPALSLLARGMNCAFGLVARSLDRSQASAAMALKKSSRSGAFAVDATRIPSVIAIMQQKCYDCS
jgi:hypothetical protein